MNVLGDGDDRIAIIGLILITMLSMLLLDNPVHIVNSVVSGLLGYLKGRAT